MSQRPNSLPGEIQKLVGKRIVRTEDKKDKLVIHFDDNTSLEIGEYAGPGADHEWYNCASVKLVAENGKEQTIFRT